METAVRSTDQVNSRDRDMHTIPRLDPDCRVAELMGPDYQVARHDTVVDYRPFAVNVGNEGIERAHALDQARLELRPGLLGNDPRHRVERENPLTALVVTIDVEGYPHRLEHLMCPLRQLGESLGIHTPQIGHNARAFGPGPALQIKHFVDGLVAHIFSIPMKCSLIGHRNACEM